MNDFNFNSIAQTALKNFTPFDDTHGTHISFYIPVFVQVHIVIMVNEWYIEFCSQ